MFFKANLVRQLAAAGASTGQRRPQWKTGAKLAQGARYGAEAPIVEWALRPLEVLESLPWLFHRAEWQARPVHQLQENTRTARPAKRCAHAGQTSQPGCVQVQQSPLVQLTGLFLSRASQSPHRAPVTVRQGERKRDEITASSAEGHFLSRASQSLYRAPVIIKTMRAKPRQDHGCAKRGETVSLRSWSQETRPAVHCRARGRGTNGPAKRCVHAGQKGQPVCRCTSRC